MIYGYCRVSTPKQSLERQEKNIKALYPGAIIYSDTYTGKTNDRPRYQILLKRVTKGDIIIFDEVSRMSRNATEGFQDYTMLLEKGVELKFIKEPQINTEVYRDAQKRQLDMVGDDVADPIIEGVNKAILVLAEKQFRTAFERAEQERLLLSQRTKEGMAKGRKPGRRKGVPQHQKKEMIAKRIIRKNSKMFGGSLSNTDTMKLAGVTAPTFYKYLKEMKENAADRQMDINDFV